jgi:hypothetical protein
MHLLGMMRFLAAPELPERISGLLKLPGVLRIGMNCPEVLNLLVYRIYI